MAFSLDTVTSLIDSTLLNPRLAATLPLLHYGFQIPFKVIWPDFGQTYLPAVETAMPIKVCIYFALIGAMLRYSRHLSRMALNNGVVKKWNWDAGLEIALVTGGAGGIGGELVRLLIKKGIPTVVVDVMPLQYKAPPNSAPIHYYKCDIMSYEAYETVANQIRSEVGIPTIIFANAGISRGKSLLEATPRDIELTLGVNNLALIWTIKLFLPDLVKANHGHFMITGSATGYATTARMVDYSASKAAALSIWEGLQAELKHVYNAPDVKCSIICPSLVRTKMFDGIENGNEFLAPSLSPEQVAQLMADAIFAAESRHIICPSSIGMVTAYIRAWPSWVRVGMQDASHHVAANLKGHKPMGQ